MEWARLGQCKQCGDCCDWRTVPRRLRAYESVGIPVAMLGGTELEHGGRCPHFARDGNGKAWCTIYPCRPWMCRLFPQSPVDIMALPRCGYRFIPVGSSPGIGAQIPGIGGKLPARAPRPMSRQTRRRLAREEAKRLARETRRAGEAERAERLYRRHT